MCIQIYVYIKNTLAHLYIYTHRAQLRDQYRMYSSDVIGCYTALYVVKLCDHNKKVPGFPYYPLRNTVCSKRRFLVLLTLFLIHLSGRMTNGFISTNKLFFSFYCALKPAPVQVAFKLVNMWSYVLAALWPGFLLCLFALVEGYMHTCI